MEQARRCLSARRCAPVARLKKKKCILWPLAQAIARACAKAGCDRAALKELILDGKLTKYSSPTVSGYLSSVLKKKIKKK